MKITLTTSEILTLLEGVSSRHLVQDWTLKIRDEIAAIESDRDQWKKTAMNNGSATNELPVSWDEFDQVTILNNNLESERDKWKLEADHANDRIKEIDLDLTEAEDTRDMWKTAAGERDDKIASLQSTASKSLTDTQSVIIGCHRQRDDAREAADRWEKQTKVSWGRQEELGVDLDVANRKIAELESAVGEMKPAPSEAVMDRLKYDADRWRRAADEANDEITKMEVVRDNLDAERDLWKSVSGERKAERDEANDKIAALEARLDGFSDYDVWKSKALGLWDEAAEWRGRARDLASRISATSGVAGPYSRLDELEEFANRVALEVEGWE